MAKIKPIPIPEEIKEYLSYDELTGDLTWIKRAGSRGTVGDIAGCVDNAYNYTLIRFKKVLYRSHRIAWFLKTGEQPPDEIDHTNKTRIDNAEGNLRKATSSENSCNRGKQSNNTSGYKGVSWSKRRNKWKASISKDCTQHYLGYFDTPELAYEAYCNASKKLHGEFSNIG